MLLNGLVGSRRCDPQSACARRASQLLERLVQINDDSPTTSFWMSTAQARNYWLRVPSEMRDLIWEQILDDETHHLLTHADCPVLALRVIDEACMQLSPHSQLWNYVCELTTIPPEHEEEKQRVKRAQRAWLRVLRALLLAFPRQPDPHVQRLLTWYVPQQMGHGVESLQALHLARKKRNPSLNY
jgi:hypothetical protein